MSNFRPMLARYDLTEQQWRVLRALAESGRIDATEMCSRAHILPPSLSRIIRSLERGGYLAILKDESDGRRVLLALTSAGTRLVAEILPHSTEIYRRLEAKLGPAWIDDLLGRLETLSAVSGALGANA